MATTVEKIEPAVLTDEARRVLSVLYLCHAYCPEDAVTDAVIAIEAKVPARNVIDLARELAEHDHAVVSVCGGQSGGRGRYIESDPAMVRQYANGLHDRAKAIHGRAKAFSDLAERMEARRNPDSRGQERLFT